jgi:hypothetical protein
VPRYKPLQQTEIARANLQSAAALYVPLLHYPTKTATKQPTSRRSSTFGKRSLRVQSKFTLPDESSFSLIVLAAMRE